jgi:hypothetical protein
LARDTVPQAISQCDPERPPPSRGQRAPPGSSRRRPHRSAALALKPNFEPTVFVPSNDTSKAIDDAVVIR